MTPTAKRFQCRLILTFLLACCPVLAQISTFTAPVIGISDGDTIRLLHDGVSERVRLWGIDCPESKQPFGTRAKQFTGDLAFGKTVKVIVRDYDRCHRTVAEIVLPGGRKLNREIVRAGFAWWFVRYARQDTELRGL
jgi:micrococcal nuclease